MMKNESDKSQRMTRAQIKDILKVNYELFKEDENFFDYITDLAIYLMEFEYEGNKGEPAAADVTGPLPEPSMRRPNDVKLLDSGRHVHPGYCPHCNGELKPDSTICPFCLALIRS